MMASLLRPLLQLLLRARVVRATALAVAYSSVIAASIALAYLLRFDFDVPGWLRPNLVGICAIAVAVQLASMYAFHQFDGLLSFFSTPDLKRLVLACTVAAAALGGLRLAFGVEIAPPRGVILMHYCLSVLALSGMRMTFRRVRLLAFQESDAPAGKARRIGIVGAGDCGASLAKELLRKRPLALHPVAFFDDHRDSQCSIHGVPVAGAP